MPVVETNDQTSDEQGSGLEMSSNLQFQSSSESSKKMSPQTRRSNVPAVKPKLDLGQPSGTIQSKSQPQTSTVTSFVPNEATSEIPECTPASIENDIFCPDDILTEEPSGREDRCLTVKESGLLKDQNVSENQSRGFSDARFVPSLEHATEKSESLSTSGDGKHPSHPENIESASTNPVTSDTSATEPQVELGSNADSLLAQEDSQNSAAVEDLPVSEEPVSDVASACQSRRSRLQKLKPKPNLLLTSRTSQRKPKVTENATEKHSSPTQIPESHKGTIAVVETEQTCATPPVKTNQNTGPAPDLMPSLGLDSAVMPTEALSTTVEKNTEVGVIVQLDSGGTTSGQSVSENLNFSEEFNREQASTLTKSTSESTDEKPMPELCVSGSNPAASEILITESQVGQWSSTDCAPVEENSGHSASFATRVENVSVSQEAVSKTAHGCLPRSRLSKVKPKPNLPQASRSPRCKPQLTEDSMTKDSSPAPINKLQEKSIAEEEPKQTCFTQSTVPASHLKSSAYLGSSLTPSEESTTEEKNADVGVFGKEHSGATTSDSESDSESQKFSVVQFQPSTEQSSAVITSESTEYTNINPVSSDTAGTRSEVRQGSNKDSGPAKGDSDHSAAYSTPAVDLEIIQTIEDEDPSSCQSRISGLQQVKPKSNQTQTVRGELPTTEEPVMQKPPNPAPEPESSDNPTAEVEVQPTSSSNFAETSSVSVLSLEMCTKDQELSSAEGQKTDNEVRLHSSSESSEPNSSQRRRRFTKVKPKPNLMSSIRTTRSKLQPKDSKPEKHQMDVPEENNSAQTKLEPTEQDREIMTSLHCPLKTELLTSTKSAFSESEMSLENTNDMGSSADMIVTTSGTDGNQSMLTDSVPENKNGEKSTGEKLLSSNKVEDGPASERDFKLDTPTRVTELNTQPTDDPTAISVAHSSEDVLTTDAYSMPDPEEHSHQSCPVSDSEEKRQDVAQQSSEMSENNQTSNNKSQSASGNDESQSESSDCPTTLKKASPTRRGRLQPRPNLGCSTKPPKPQQVQSTTQAEAESCSYIAGTSVSQPVTELRPDVQEPAEGAVKQHSVQDFPPEDSGSSLCGLSEIRPTQSTTTSSLEAPPNHPGLTVFSDMLSQQVPSDPDEPFFILSLTEIPVGSSGEVVDRAVESLPYLPLTDASTQRQSCVLGESLAAAEDGSQSDVPVSSSSVIHLNDIGADPATDMGLIVKNPVDAQEGATVQSPALSENVENDDVESAAAKQKRTGSGRKAKLQVKSSSARKTRRSKSLTTNATQDLHPREPSVQPDASDTTADASDEVFSEPQKGSGAQADIKEETQTRIKESCSGPPTQSTKTRTTGSRSRNSKQALSFLPEKNSPAASTDPACGTAVSKSSKVRTSRAAGKQLSTTLHDVAATPSRTQTPHAAHSELSSMSPTQTEEDVRQTPTPSTSQCTAEVSVFSMDHVESDSVEEPTCISQYFLSDIFTEVEEE
ncbi:hypothetical protein Q5P01_024276 [Channa striata]|uniref:B double prime 1, subunit of RNA polymerase III transcription initiation factor IIIB n=1 Tax=Channa striata TaxID=64152 RepID=A0AA88J7K0_CHASR|nr:hypothetical protein Q5P01_024276 [Channa striata]